MTPKEIKQRIEDGEMWEELYNLVANGGSYWACKNGIFIKELPDTSLVFEYVKDFRSPISENEVGSWTYLFKIDSQLFACYASYNSWEGRDFLLSYIKEMVPVSPIEVVTTEYHKVCWE